MKTKDGLWKLSPSGLYTYEACKACFWLEQHIGRGPSVPMRLNDAMDEKMKHRYDLYREKGELPPEIKGKLGGVKLFDDLAVLDPWRTSWTAFRYENNKDGYAFGGKIDEIFVTDRGEVIPVDFKSSGDVPKADKQKYYRLQLHAYALMLRENGYKTADRAYLVHYFTKERDNPDLTMEFDSYLDEVKIDLERFEKTLRSMVEFLNQNYPGADKFCRNCVWQEKRDRAIHNDDTKGQLSWI